MAIHSSKRRLPIICVLITLTLCLSILTGCKKSGSEEDGDSNENPSSEQPTQTGTARSACGIVEDQSFAGLSSNAAIPVSIQEILKPDLFIVQRTEGSTGPELVQLLGVTTDGVSNSLVQLGKDNLRRELGTRAYYIPGSCPITVQGGGVATLGQLFFRSGQSVAEHLIANASVKPQDNGCGASELVGCYNSIDVDEPVSTQTISWFLWKPVSESNGNLAILVDPFQIDVRVNGTRLTNTGPSNGRGTTARANRSGCSFGANARVEFFDRLGRRVLIDNGARSITVANGCNRVETRY